MSRCVGVRCGMNGFESKVRSILHQFYRSTYGTSLKRNISAARITASAASMAREIRYS